MRTLITIVLALAACWTTAGAAAAATPPPGPALDQYVETIPTATGPSAATPGKTRGGGSTQRTVPLAPATAAKIQAEGGEDAEVLKKIATQPDLGAPEAPLPQAGAEEQQQTAQPGQQPQAAAEITSSDGYPVTMLVALLAGITLVLGGVAGYSFARRRD
jgi:hypothetical protein